MKVMCITLPGENYSCLTGKKHVLEIGSFFTPVQIVPIGGIDGYILKEDPVPHIYDARLFAPLSRLDEKEFNRNIAINKKVSSGVAKRIAFAILIFCIIAIEVRGQKALDTTGFYKGKFNFYELVVTDSPGSAISVSHQLYKDGKFSDKWIIEAKDTLSAIKLLCRRLIEVWKPKENTYPFYFRPGGYQPLTVPANIDTLTFTPTAYVGGGGGQISSPVTWDSLWVDTKHMLHETSVDSVMPLTQNKSSNYGLEHGTFITATRMGKSTYYRVCLAVGDSTLTCPYNSHIYNVPKWKTKWLVLTNRKGRVEIRPED